MKKIKMNGILTLGIILIILSAWLFCVAILAFCGVSIDFDFTYNSSSSKNTTYGYGYGYGYDLTGGMMAMIWFILFLTIGIILLSYYTAYKKENDKLKMEKMLEEKYGVKMPILNDNKIKPVQNADAISIEEPKIVNCNDCNTEIECYENQQIIRCSQCGKAYKNPYYKEK